MPAAVAAGDGAVGDATSPVDAGGDAPQAPAATPEVPDVLPEALPEALPEEAPVRRRRARRNPTPARSAAGGTEPVVAGTPAAEPVTASTAGTAAEVTASLATPRAATARRATARAAGAAPTTGTDDVATDDAVPDEAVSDDAVSDEAQSEADQPGSDEVLEPRSALAMPLFQAPTLVNAPRRARRAASRPAGPPQASGPQDGETGPQVDVEEPTEDDEPLDELAPGEEDDDSEETEPGPRRRRRRGGRGRRGRTRAEGESAEGADGSGQGDDEPSGDDAAEDGDEADEDSELDAGETGEGTAGSRRRRRRRRRGGSGGEADPGPDDPPNTVVKVRESRRGSGDDVTGLRGSTRLEAKKQRRREGREAGRRRPVITEAEFLARRESVDRVMLVREREGRTQIGVLEDGVLVEHYVARRTQTSMVGNVYLGKVQNVLPSMEAAFVDIGKGRNAVLYAGEVNWDAAGLEGQPKRIEHALKSGESVLVQVTKDPIGHKGARLTSQVSLPGRYLVYVPDGSMTGISRKLPDTERARLKKILRAVVPDDAGVIVRTAAEGASEQELERDVARLQAQWEDIAEKAGAVNAPALLYGEPDLAIRVVRDIFNEDFGKLVISGDDAWDTLHAYIGHVAPDLVSRLERWSGEDDVFAANRVDEQLAKALERKVWLPSGGSLVIDRTEAMTVVDVNTGKFTGAGGNLEETVTKNNIEAAEEIVRQLRLRDIGGIIVVDFIDMVLESNRDLVLRRLLECLGRDRTKHQVAEVTSLGLVQMTRKRVGQGLLEVFSETCEHCGGRGVIVHDEPVEKRQQVQQDSGRQPRTGRSGRGQRGGRAADDASATAEPAGAEGTSVAAG